MVNKPEEPPVPLPKPGPDGEPYTTSTGFAHSTFILSIFIPANYSHEVILLVSNLLFLAASMANVRGTYCFGHTGNQSEDLYDHDDFLLVNFPHTLYVCFLALPKLLFTTLFTPKGISFPLSILILLSAKFLLFRVMHDDVLPLPSNKYLPKRLFHWVVWLRLNVLSTNRLWSLFGAYYDRAWRYDWQALRKVRELGEEHKTDLSNDANFVQR